MAATTSAPPQQVSLIVKKITPVGVWKFSREVNEQCPICQQDLTQRCLECQVDDTKQCGLSSGRCGHMFHICCISGWATRENNGTGKAKCPYCFNDWELYKEEYNHC